MTRYRRAAVRLATAAFAAVLGGFVVPAPAAADVTVTPSTAVRGGAVKLIFRLSEDRAPAHTTKIELHLPAEAPIAEVYPMSASDWAPRVVMRKLDRPVAGWHGSVGEVVSAITWTRFEGGESAPGTPPELAVSLGALPDTEQLLFTLVQTYSDGTVVRWGDPPAAGDQRPKNPAVVVKLQAPPPSAVDHEEPAAEASEETGWGYGVIGAAALLGVVAGVLGGWLLLPRFTRIGGTAAAGDDAAGDDATGDDAAGGDTAETADAPDLGKPADTADTGAPDSASEDSAPDAAQPGGGQSEPVRAETEELSATKA